MKMDEWEGKPALKRASQMILIGLTVLAALILWAVLPTTAQDATPTPAIVSPTTAPLSNEAEAALSEAKLASMRVDLALDSVDKILAIIQVVGVVGAIATAVIAVAGWRSSREFNEEMDKLRGMEGNLQQALNEVNSARDLLTKIESAQQEITRLRNEVGTSLAEVRLSRDELDANMHQVERQISDSYKASGLAQLGQRQIALGNMRAASGVFEEICALDPANPIYRYFLGDLLIRQGRVDEGIEHLRRARQDNYKYPSADVSYAYALRLRGDEEADEIRRERWYHEAGDIFLGVYEIDADLVDISGESVFGALAGLYRRQGRYETALQWYEHCYRVTPNNSYPINNLAVLHFRMGHWEESIHHFKRALAKAQEKVNLRPSDHWARFDLITARVGLGATYESLLPEIEQAFATVSGVSPLKKFMYGLEDMQAAPNLPAKPRAVIEQLIGVIQDQMSGRNA